MVIVMHIEAEESAPHDGCREPRWNVPAEGQSRFVRDVHDLLGSHLLALTLKGELARRLIETDPERTAVELAEVLGLGERALIEVREAGGGDVRLTLAEEVARARAVLSSAGVELNAVGTDIRLPGPVETAFAAVVREGVANVLRHSSARHCDITVMRTDTTASVTVVNDRPHGPTATGGGSGLGSLAFRMASVGGALTTSRRKDRMFLLGGSAPLTSRPDGRDAEPQPEQALRDLLHCSLGIIVDKARHALALCPSAPDKARAELDAMLGIARRTLSRIRRAAARGRSLTLAPEACSASSALADAGIEPHVRLGLAVMPPQVYALFTVVLRTGVKCVLRHSRVTSCQISVVQTNEDFRLDIVSDGISPPFGFVERGVVTGLQRRLGMVDGSLSVDLQPDGAVAFYARVPRHRARA